MGPTLSPLQCVLVFFPGGEAECEVDDAFTGAEVKNEWKCICAPPPRAPRMPLWHGKGQICLFTAQYRPVCIHGPSLHLPVANLDFYQKRFHYSSIKTFDSLPSSITF